MGIILTYQLIHEATILNLMIGPFTVPCSTAGFENRIDVTGWYGSNDLAIILAVEQVGVDPSRAFFEQCRTVFGKVMFAESVGHLLGGLQSGEVPATALWVGSVEFAIVGIVLDAFHDAVAISVPGAGGPDESENPLIHMTLTDFANETASESPAPGGGSISAYMGALGASLGTMVANLSAQKKGWEDRWEAYSNRAEKGQHYKDELLKMVDEDTHAFNRIMEAYGLPKSNENEKEVRKQAIQEAIKYAMEIPFRVMELSLASMDVIKAMAEIGNPNSITDAGVGALAARSAIIGAFLNVKINAAGLDDKDFVYDILTKGEDIEKRAVELEKEIFQLVNSKI